MVLGSSFGNHSNAGSANWSYSALTTTSESYTLTNGQSVYVVQRCLPHCPSDDIALICSGLNSFGANTPIKLFNCSTEVATTIAEVMPTTIKNAANPNFIGCSNLNKHLLIGTNNICNMYHQSTYYAMWSTAFPTSLIYPDAIEIQNDDYLIMSNSGTGCLRAHPITESYSSVPACPVTIRCSCKLNNGLIMVMGASGSYCLYDVRIGWSAAQSNGGDNRSYNHKIAATSTGAIMWGGHNINSKITEKYDSMTNTWNINNTSMINNHNGSVWSLMGNGNLIIIGNASYAASNIDIYNPLTNAFSSTTITPARLSPLTWLDNNRNTWIVGGAQISTPYIKMIPTLNWG